MVSSLERCPYPENRFKSVPGIVREAYKNGLFPQWEFIVVCGGMYRELHSNCEEDTDD